MFFVLFVVEISILPQRRPEPRVSGAGIFDDRGAEEKIKIKIMIKITIKT
jgi:hypothetical protein